MKNIGRHAVILNMFYGSSSAKARSDTPPQFRNIFIKDLTCEGAANAIVLRGLPERPIENVVLENITISSKQGLTASDSRNIRVADMKITPRQGPVMRLHNCSDFDILRAVAPQGTNIFLQVEGDRSKDIRLKQYDLRQAEKPVVLKSGVQSDAVKGIE